MSTINVSVGNHWAKLASSSTSDFLISWETPVDLEFATINGNTAPGVYGHKLNRSQILNRLAFGTGNVWARLANPMMKGKKVTVVVSNSDIADPVIVPYVNNWNPNIVPAPTESGTPSAPTTPVANLFALNTPLIFEGDSNTDTQYSIASWAKRAVLEAGSRYYIPAGGFLAGAGGTISGNNGNSMDARKDRAVALIQKMVSNYGKCIMYFQIGTNGAIGMTDEQAISDLAALVALYRGAGALVYANTCPTYGGQGNTSQTFLAKLNTWIMTAGNVDDFVDVNTVITSTDSNDRTHYNVSGCYKVGVLAGTFLKNKIVNQSIYTDDAVPIFSGEMEGTGGTSENQILTGDFAAGWLFKNVYQKAMTVTGSKVQIDGHTHQRLKIDCGAEGALFGFEPQQQGDLIAPVGSYVDFMASVRLVEGSGSYWLYNQSGNVQGGFPARDTLTDLPIEVWDGPFIWRTYTPYDRTAANGKQAFAMLGYVQANSSITFDIGRMRGTVRPA